MTQEQGPDDPGFFEQVVFGTHDGDPAKTAKLTVTVVRKGELEEQLTLAIATDGEYLDIQLDPVQWQVVASQMLKGFDYYHSGEDA